MMFSTFPIGSLIQTDNYFLMVYETWEGARSAGIVGEHNGTCDWQQPVNHIIEDEVAYQSERLGISVSYVSPGTPLLVCANIQDANEVFVKILFGETLGWIIYRDWLDFNFKLTKPNK